MTVLSVVPANRLNMNEIRSEIGSPATNLFDFKWSDHILNDIQWLRGDTFSWQSGLVYTTAYEHLVDDFDGTTSATETIGSYTITYYLAEDGHKIVLSDMEATIQNIYNESGVAWYYILDTDNQRFKLPRTKYGFTGLRDTVGKYVAAGLPDHKHTSLVASDRNGNPDGGDDSGGGRYYWRYSTTWYNTSNASSDNSIYGNSTTVQPPATQMYLYFYVGNFSQSATEQTAGLSAELFNDKADADLNNASITSVFATLLNGAGIRTVVETYVNGTSWYRVWSDGWCEQGGRGALNETSTTTITLLKPYLNTYYSVQAVSITASTVADTEAGLQCTPLSTSQITLTCHYINPNSQTASWQAWGYIA